MLNNNQLKFIELYGKGCNISDIAKEVGVSRPTIYSYMGNREVKAELDKRSKEVRDSATQSMSNNVNRYIRELEKIAFGSESDKTRADAIQYLMDRVLGRATNKIADVTEEENKNNNIDLDADMKELDNMNNVINLECISKAK